MTTLRLYVGVGFDAIAFAESVLLPFFGGATITDSIGLWQSPDGQVFNEPGHVIAVVIDGYEQYQQLVKFAKAQAHSTGEQAVMVEWHDKVSFENAEAA